MIYCPVCNQERDIKDNGTCVQCDSNLATLVRWKGMPDAYFTEAINLRDKGEVDGAIEKLILALTINSSFVKGYIELARLYVKKSLYESATAHYTNVLKLDPDNTDAKEGIESIQKIYAKKTRDEKIGRIYAVVRMSVSFIAGICLLFIIQNFIGTSSFRQTPPMPSQNDSFQGVSKQGGISASLTNVSEMNANKSSYTMTESAAKSKILYTVQKGDSLTGIAAKKYGSASLWHHVYEFNNKTIKNPDVLMIGEVLELREIRVTPR